jgi:hypothetical protein
MIALLVPIPGSPALLSHIRTEASRVPRWAGTALFAGLFWDCFRLCGRLSLVPLATLMVWLDFQVRFRLLPLSLDWRISAHPMYGPKDAHRW